MYGLGLSRKTELMKEYSEFFGLHRFPISLFRYSNIGSLRDICIGFTIHSCKEGIYV